MDIDLNDPEILQSFSQKLLKISKEIDIPGYQKGHIPPHVVITHYRDQIMKEICGEKVDQTLKILLQENQYSYLYYSEFMLKEQKQAEDDQAQMFIHVEVNFLAHEKDEFIIPGILDSFKVFLKTHFESQVYKLAYLAPESLIQVDKKDAAYVLIYDASNVVPVKIVKENQLDLKHDYHLLLDYITIDFEKLSLSLQENATLKEGLENINKKYIHNLFDTFLSQHFPKEVYERNNFKIPSELASKIDYKEADLVLRYLLDNNQEIRQFDFSDTQNYAYDLLFSNPEINTYVAQLS